MAQPVTTWRRQVPLRFRLPSSPHLKGGSGTKAWPQECKSFTRPGVKLVQIRPPRKDPQGRPAMQRWLDRVDGEAAARDRAFNNFLKSRGLAR